MYRNEFEMSEMVSARQADVIRSCQQRAIRLSLRPRPAPSRVRRAIGQRIVSFGMALVGPL